MSFSPSFAFLTGSIGTGEWIVLFVVILLVVGPKRLPEIARKLGRTMEVFRRAADEFKDQLMNMDQESPSETPSYSSPDDGYSDDSTYPDEYAEGGFGDEMDETGSYDHLSHDTYGEEEDASAGESVTDSTPEPVSGDAVVESTEQAKNTAEDIV
jgi:sec-independent protein translocase protein TatA